MKWWALLIVGLALGLLIGTAVTTLKAGASVAHDGSYDQVYTFSESEPGHIWVWIQDDEDYVARCIEAEIKRSGDIEVNAHYQ